MEALALFLIAVFLGGGLAVEGAGGAQLGKAFVLVRDGDLEREDMTDVLFPQTLLLEWEIVTNLDLHVDNKIYTIGGSRIAFCTHPS